MIKKKKCEKCGKKISDRYEFCPYCGNSFNEDSRWGDGGMLGKNDSLDEFDDFSKAIFGGIGGKMINKMLGNAMRMLENEMQKEMKRKDPQHKANFQLFINGKKINLENKSIPMQKKEIKTPLKEISFSGFSRDKSKKFSSLPKKEPTTKIRRLSNKVIYEIYIPGVRSIKDISIIKLENSIEIKAFGKNKAYFKLIPINLPIINYNFSDAKLVLEFGIKN
jgi:HSP20 family molecular chaperone IbpA